MPHDTPTTASAEQGEVLLDGPDGVAVSLTPDAAAASATAIAKAAEKARHQTPDPHAEEPTPRHTLDPEDADD